MAQQLLLLFSHQTDEFFLCMCAVMIIGYFFLMIQCMCTSKDSVKPSMCKCLHTERKIDRVRDLTLHLNIWIIIGYTEICSFHPSTCY